MTIASDVFYRLSWGVGLADQEQARTDGFYSKAEGAFFIPGKRQQTANRVSAAKDIDFG